jgi:hypothetical protein
MAARFRRGLRLVLTLGMLATTAGSAGLALWQSPFTAPMVARSTEAARLSLERAVARTVDAAWLLPRLAEALDEDDLERALMLADLAREHEVALPPPLATRLAEARARHAG